MDVKIKILTVSQPANDKFSDTDSTQFLLRKQTTDQNEDKQEALVNSIGKWLRLILQLEKLPLHERNLRGLVKERRKVIKATTEAGLGARRLLDKHARNVMISAKHMYEVLDPAVPIDLPRPSSDYKIDLRFTRKPCNIRHLRLATQYLDIVARAAQAATVCACLAMEMANRCVYTNSFLHKIQKKTTDDYYKLNSVPDALEALFNLQEDWQIMHKVKVRGVEQGGAFFNNVAGGMANAQKTFTKTVQAIQVFQTCDADESEAVATLRAATVVRRAMECVQEASVLTSHGNSLRYALGLSLIWTRWTYEDGYGGLGHFDMCKVFADEEWVSRETADNSFVEEIVEVYQACCTTEAITATALRLSVEDPWRAGKSGN
ncbi:hypothetical protein SEUCBS140593_010103 [Sporothrix eucalyptigena]|uniref:Uncharacterized protein n=1 Tax=Sporothrix eucalyptigena TaxID=1812306 RepID=A0ABP0D019_9PEZI